MDSALKERFIALFLDVMKLETFDEEASMDSLVQWDSLKQVQLISSMEDELELSIDFEDIMQMTSVPKIFEVLERVTQENG